MRQRLLGHLLLLYGATLFVYLLARGIGPAERGYVCGSIDVSLPYKHDTISTEVMFVGSLLTIFVSIVIAECFYLTKLERRGLHGATLYTLTIRSLLHFGHSQLGFASLLMLTEATKYTAGRLRPHFLDVCRPLLNTTCTPGTFVWEYTCTGDAHLIRESRLSFFSGHTATTTYAAVFVSLHLHSRLCSIYTPVFVPVVQTVLLAVAAIVGNSRVNDHMHHSDDVLFGFLVGTIVAFVTVHIWHNCFVPSRYHRREAAAAGWFAGNDEQRDRLVTHLSGGSTTSARVHTGVTGATTSDHVVAPTCSDANRSLLSYGAIDDAATSPSQHHHDLTD